MALFTLLIATAGRFLKRSGLGIAAGFALLCALTIDFASWACRWPRWPCGWYGASATPLLYVAALWLGAVVIPIVK